MPRNYFGPKEFACKDGCGLNCMDPEIVKELNITRHICGFPFYVTSGCRCEPHNKKEGGKKTSAHKKKKDGYCHGVDIKIGTSTRRDKFLEVVYQRRKIGKGFRRIGIHKGFIHVDNDKTKPQGITFLY